MDAKQNLLSSILNYSSQKDKLQELESRANHSINAIINLMDDIDDEFDEEVSADLKKRIFLCIKSKDYSRFERALIKLLKDKENE